MYCELEENELETYAEDGQEHEEIRSFIGGEPDLDTFDIILKLESPLREGLHDLFHNQYESTSKGDVFHFFVRKMKDNALYPYETRLVRACNKHAIITGVKSLDTLVLLFPNRSKEFLLRFP
jgi:hypothetical protein